MILRHTLIKTLIAAAWVASGILLLGSCSKPKELPPEIAAQYQKDAERFCGAIVQCMKDDIAAKMASEPERRDMILRRMTRDLCIAGQFQVIGLSSADVGAKKPVYKPELYKAYSECSLAVANAKDCKARLQIHSEHPSCKMIRKPLD